MRADRDAGVEQPQLELAQDLLAAAIGVRDQRADDDAARDRRLERFLELDAIEPENHDVDGLLRVADRLHQRRQAVVRLDDELHFVLFFFSDHSTAAWPSRIEPEDGVGDAVGLHFERHLHIVADLFVRRRAELELQLKRCRIASIFGRSASVSSPALILSRKCFCDSGSNDSITQSARR